MDVSIVSGNHDPVCQPSAGLSPSISPMLRWGLTPLLLQAYESRYHRQLVPRHLLFCSPQVNSTKHLFCLPFYFILELINGASQVVLVVKNPPANAGDLRDTGSIPGSGKSPGGRHSNPLQYSCLENPLDRGITVHRVAKSQTRLRK